MSFTIDTAFVKQYHANIEYLLQQMGSQLRPYVRVESQQGEEGYWEQLDKSTPNEVFTRFADSPVNEATHFRRKVILRQWDIGNFIDKFDKVKLLIDPASAYVQTMVWALGRSIDMTIIGRVSENTADAANMVAAGLGGFHNTAFTGKSGTTSTAFPSANIVAVDFGSTGVNSNLNVAKIREARRLLISFFNVPGRETWHFGYTSSQLSSLLSQTQITSADYNSVKALVYGEVDSFLGFKFVHSEYYLNNATPYRMIPVWTKNGMLMALGKDIETNVAQRADKRFSWYAYALASVGSTRMQENKVLEVLCDETVT